MRSAAIVEIEIAADLGARFGHVVVTRIVRLIRPRVDPIVPTVSTVSDTRSAPSELGPLVRLTGADDPFLASQGTAV
jgi:hypothetical protein